MWVHGTRPPEVKFKEPVWGVAIFLEWMCLLKGQCSNTVRDKPNPLGGLKALSGVPEVPRVSGGFRNFEDTSEFQAFHVGSGDFRAIRRASEEFQKCFMASFGGFQLVSGAFN